MVVVMIFIFGACVADGYTFGDAILRVLGFGNAGITVAPSGMHTSPTINPATPGLVKGLQINGAIGLGYRNYSDSISSPSFLVIFFIPQPIKNQSVTRRQSLP